MRVNDYNGTGKWSAAEILERYQRYCREFKIAEPLDIAPRRFAPRDANGSTPVCWIYPVMGKVIPGIELGDEGCKRIGIEFIEEDQTFPFGRILKSNTARALRRASLSPTDQERIRKRVVGMLLARHVPREYREYAKLLRTVGIGSYWSIIERDVNRANRYVMRWYDYFRMLCPGAPSSIAPLSTTPVVWEWPQDVEPRRLVCIYSPGYPSTGTPRWEFFLMGDGRCGIRLPKPEGGPGSWRDAKYALSMLDEANTTELFRSAARLHNALSRANSHTRMAKKRTLLRISARERGNSAFLHRFEASDPDWSTSFLWQTITRLISKNFY